MQSVPLSEYHEPPGWIEHIATWMYFFTLYLLVHGDVVSSLFDWYLGDGDVALYIWITNALTQKLQALNTSIFDLPFFYPFGESLAYSDNYLLPSLISALVRVCGGSEPLAFNAPLLIAAASNGFFSCLLVRYLTRSLLAGLISGTAFMLSPFLFVETVHPQLQFAFFFPAGMLFLLQALKTYSVTSSFALGLCLLGSFLCSVYYFYYLALLLGFLFLGLIVLSPSSLSFTGLLKLLFCNVPNIIGLWFMSQAYRHAALSFGMRKLGDVEAEISLRSFLSIPENNLFWTAQIGKVFAEKVQLFPGAIALCLAGIGVLAALFHVGQSSYSPAETRKIQFMFVLSFLFFLVIGLGPRQYFGSIDVYRILFEHLPGFSALRATGRAGVVCLVILCVFAGYGVAALLRYGGGVTVFMLMILLVGVVFELRTSAYPVFSPKENFRIPVQVTAEAGGAGLVLPYPDYFANETEFSSTQLSYMNGLRHTSLRLVNGYSGVQPHYHKTLGRYLKGFPDEASLQRMSELVGLKWVIISRSASPEFNEKQFLESLQKFKDRVTLEHVDSFGNYYLRLQSKVYPVKQRILLPAGLLQHKSYCLTFVRAATAEAAGNISLRLERADDTLDAELGVVSFAERQAEATIRLGVSTHVSPVEPLRIRFIPDGAPNAFADLRLREIRSCP